MFQRPMVKWPFKRPLILALVAATSLVGCVADTGLDDEAKGRRDWRTNHRLMSDATFRDTSITAAQLQEFLAEKPSLNGTNASWLATYKIGNQKFSERLAALADANDVNPLLLLAWLQMNSGLVARTTQPSAGLMNSGLNCGCAPDGTCGDGLDGQFKCLAQALNGDFESAKQNGKVSLADGSGREVKLDETFNGVAPMNRSSLAIFARLGGNMRSLDLLYEVFTQYVGQLNTATGRNFDRFKELPPAEGFIGGACTSNSDCFFDQAVCRPSGSKRICTRACSANTMCPDRLGAPTTYCVSSSTARISGSGGFCLPQCSGDSCGTGFQCQQNVPRLGQTTHTRNVCVATGTTSSQPTGTGSPQDGVDTVPSLDPDDRWTIKIVRVVAPPRDTNEQYFDSAFYGWYPDMTVEMSVDDRQEMTVYNDEHDDSLDIRINQFLFVGGLDATTIRKPITVKIWDQENVWPVEISRCPLQITDSHLLRNLGERTLNCGEGKNENRETQPFVLTYEVQRIDTSDAVEI